MSDSLLRHIALSERPLIVCDIDEVVLEFVTPFIGFLRSDGYEFIPRSYRLTGNILSASSGEVIDGPQVRDLIETFFARQEDWQTPVDAAADTLAGLSGDADIVFLTAMPPRFETMRRAVLDRFNFGFPMIATEEAKGPVVARLHNRRALPVAFLDDTERNLISVRDHVPECLLISMIANRELRALAPPPPKGIVSAAGWDEADRMIRSHFGLAL